MEKNEADVCREFSLVNPTMQKICKHKNQNYQCAWTEWIENKAISKAWTTWCR